ncbi:hypothetical protein Bca4012_060011 [Brassica carinata]
MWVTLSSSTVEDTERLLFPEGYIAASTFYNSGCCSWIARDGLLSTLGGLTSKVLLAVVTYFIASEMLDIAENVGIIDDVSGREKLFLVLPEAFLDAFLILWIFTSLSKTLEQLQMKRTSVKLDIYLVVASVAWIVYEVYFKATDPFNERWQTRLDRYAYAGEVDEENEEVQSLTGGKQDCGISLAKIEKNSGSDTQEHVEEDKRE